jgi:enoyl-CoA hydratase
MSYKTIEYEKSGHLALIRFRGDMEDRDAVINLSHDLSDVAQNINSDKDIWAVVFMGLGANPIPPGKDWITEDPKPQDLDDILAGSFTESIAGIDRPVIAGISGEALDRNLELALACDIRVATEESRFGFTHLEKGLIPRNGGTQRLARLVGKAKAMEMILTGMILDGPEAYRIGLITRVVKSEELENTVMAIAGEMVAKGPIALKYAKEAVNKGMELTLEQGIRLEADLYMLIHTSRDRTEGIRAFQEKRRPQFEGR